MLLTGHCTGFHSAFASVVVFLLSSFSPALNISGFCCHSFHLYLRVAGESYLSFAGAVESSELESGVILVSSSGSLPACRLPTILEPSVGFLSGRPPCPGSGLLISHMDSLPSRPAAPLLDLLPISSPFTEGCHVLR